MDSAEMMKMATGDGFPLRQGAETGSGRFLVATEACGGGTSNLLCSSVFLGYVDIYRRKKSARGATTGPREGRAHLGGGRAPLSRGLLDDPLARTPSS